MKEILREKSYAFALRIVNLSEYLHKEKHEYVLSRKVLDSGTNIGLFIEEGKQGTNT
ncbi:MAG TPA: four helix bundle protein [Pyrinomonadaceae bacterium]|nr:four helix bundle protein [Acidobacteriota bacterium]HQZ94739.1 four helix bundle protein [Pyrinomonadaceae bacterium]